MTARVPVENPRGHGENAQPSHTERHLAQTQGFLAGKINTTLQLKALKYQTVIYKSTFVSTHVFTFEFKKVQ